ncbi:MAG: HAMP domain-containing protein [Symploca sp. SIO2E6]|nr:HAMP domain-containing protein [Symploca sp. SIO2E6]
MTRFLPGIPIGVKIFGIATSMLSLLIGVAYINHDRIAQVNDELTDIADYITPVTERVARVNVYVLEQQLHFERVLRFYEMEPVDLEQVEQEMINFDQRGRLVDQEIEEAIALSQEAIDAARKTPNLIEFARLEPLLNILENEHQKLHDSSLVIFNLLQADKREEARLLEEQLEQYEEDFEQRSQSILFKLGEFTQNSTIRAEAQEQETIRVSWLLATVSSGIGIPFTILITFGLLSPVRKLIRGTQEVEGGNLDVQVAVNSKDEIGILADSFNTMLDEVLEKERIKVTFGQYVDPRIVETLIEKQGNVDTSNKQVMTVFFSDIAGFSSISEMLTPVGLVNLINQYLTLASEPITQYHGVIDQFIGDAVTAFWGPPFVGETDHAKLACFAALEQFTQLARLRRMMPDIMGFRKGLPEIQVRIGLATGEVVAGNIGSEQSKSYTVMGKAMQIAEQLESANKKYGTNILLMEETKVLAADAIETREIDWLDINEREKPVRVYELLGYRGELNPRITQLRDRFEAGLREYRQQNWEQAQSHFLACLHLKADDKPSGVYLKRIELENVECRM